MASENKKHLTRVLAVLVAWGTCRDNGQKTLSYAREKSIQSSRSDFGLIPLIDRMLYLRPIEIAMKLTRGCS